MHMYMYIYMHMYMYNIDTYTSFYCPLIVSHISSIFDGQLCPRSSQKQIGLTAEARLGSAEAAASEARFLVERMLMMVFGGFLKMGEISIFEVDIWRFPENGKYTKMDG